MADSQILNHYHEIQSAKPLDQIKEDIVAGNNSRKISYPYELSKRIWKPEEVSKIEILERIYDWSFPIFQLYEISSQNILSHVRAEIFIVFFQFCIFLFNCYLLKDGLQNICPSWSFQIVQHTS